MFFNLHCVFPSGKVRVWFHQIIVYTTARNNLVISLLRQVREKAEVEFRPLFAAVCSMSDSASFNVFVFNVVAHFVCRAEVFHYHGASQSDIVIGIVRNLPMK